MTEDFPAIVIGRNAGTDLASSWLCTGLRWKRNARVESQRTCTRRELHTTCSVSQVDRPTSTFMYAGTASGAGTDVGNDMLKASGPPHNQFESLERD